MIEVKVNGADFVIGKLHAMQQLHVARRVAPLLAAVGKPLFDEIRAANGAKLSGDALLNLAIGPFSDVLAKMSDEDVEYVVFTCLGVVRKRQDKALAPVAVGQRLMFEDLEMKDMTGLVFLTLQENLGNFFPKLPADNAS